MRRGRKVAAPSFPIRRYAWVLAVLWTALVGASLLWNVRELRAEVTDLAAAEARGAFNKDVAYRRWAAAHGGVYVPVTDETPPNPYLEHVEEREVTTPSGRLLTLVNPAYMTRQVHELSAEQYGVRGHITSLDPLNPGNAPDPWEAEALRAFEQGATEVATREAVDGEGHLRLMRPLVTEQRCLKCHAHQGYEVGDVRGGLSVSVPMAPYEAVAREHVLREALQHGVLWLLGCAGLGLATVFLGRRVRERQAADAALRQSGSRLAEAQRLARLGSWDWNVRTNELVWSDEIYRIFGLRPREFGATYEAFLGFVHPDDRGLVEESVRQALEEKRPYSIEHRIVLPDGEVRVVHERGEVTFAESGEPIRMLGTVQEITERKRLEEEIRRMNEELEQRVVERTAQLRAANEELESFSYSVSHDLRAPLRTMTSFSQVLLEDHGDSLDERARDALRRIQGGGRRMGELIDDLLALSRITRAEMRSEDVDLGRMAGEIAEELRSASPERRVEIRIARGLSARGDARLLRLLLENLLGNAWKFTSREPRAWIDVGADSRDGRQAYFVRDNGAGFDMAYADKLFGVFQRLHADDEYEGTGIGLSTAQRIVRRHGGSIWGEGEVGRGAAFYFTLSSSEEERRSWTSFS